MVDYPNIYPAINKELPCKKCTSIFWFKKTFKKFF
jgi:hypothetical protein